MDKKIWIKIDVEDVEFDASQAVPIGLILNEAVIKSVKYAFDSHGDNCIKISLLAQSGNQLALGIENNGKELSPGFKFTKKNSISIALIEILTEKLGGILHFKSENGLRMVKIFSRKEFVEVPGDKI